MQADDSQKFKQCPCCDHWFSASDILENPLIEVNGMAFDHDDPEMNVFYFTHRSPECNSTFTIPTRRFEPYITELIPKEILTGTSECIGACKDKDDRRACTSGCLYAPYRRFLMKLIATKKQIRPVRFAV